MRECFCLTLPSPLLAAFCVVCLLQALCYCQDTILVRSDPGSGVSVSWPLVPAPDGRYDYISVIHGSGVALFCSRPFLAACQVNERQMALTRTPSQLGFTMPDLDWPDAGRYRMEVVTSGGRIQHRDAVLYVYRAMTKPLITGNTVVQEGDDVTLVCTSTMQSEPSEYRNTSRVLYTWLISHSVNNRPAFRPIDSELADHVTSGPRLTLRDVTRRASLRAYRCSAREENSSMTSPVSDDVTIDVRYIDAVRITGSPDLDIAEYENHDDPVTSQWRGFARVGKGDNLTLVCRAECNPECSYAWMNVSGSTEQSGLALEVSTVSCGVQAHVCQASNVISRKQAYILIEVLPRSLTTASQLDDVDYDVSDGSTAFMSRWSGADDGRDQPSVVWSTVPTATHPDVVEGITSAGIQTREGSDPEGIEAISSVSLQRTGASDLEGITGITSASLEKRGGSNPERSEAITSARLQKTGRLDPEGIEAITSASLQKTGGSDLEGIAGITRASLEKTGGSDPEGNEAITSARLQKTGGSNPEGIEAISSVSLQKTGASDLEGIAGITRASLEKTGGSDPEGIEAITSARLQKTGGSNPEGTEAITIASSQKTGGSDLEGIAGITRGSLKKTGGSDPEGVEEITSAHLQKTGGSNPEGIEAITSASLQKTGGSDLEGITGITGASLEKTGGSNPERSEAITSASLQKTGGSDPEGIEAVSSVSLRQTGASDLEGIARITSASLEKTGGSDPEGIEAITSARLQKTGGSNPEGIEPVTSVSLQTTRVSGVINDDNRYDGENKQKVKDFPVVLAAFGVGLGLWALSVFLAKWHKMKCCHNQSQKSGLYLEENSQVKIANGDLISVHL